MVADDIDSKKMKKYLPNAITVLRFILTALLIVMLSPRIGRENPGLPSGIYVVFFLICLSDFLDGRAARRFKAVSALGAALDIAADCFYIFSTLFVFAFFQILPVWYAVLVLADFSMFVATSHFLLQNNYKTGTASFVFDTIGRIAAVLFYIIPVAAYTAFNYPVFYPILNLMLYTGTLLAIVSMLERLTLCLRHRRKSAVLNVSAGRRQIKW